MKTIREKMAVIDEFTKSKTILLSSLHDAINKNDVNKFNDVWQQIIKLTVPIMGMYFDDIIETISPIDVSTGLVVAIVLDLISNIIKSSVGIKDFLTE